MDIIITLGVLLFSVIVHEVAHGLMAEKLGDDTAREEGRITLNPMVHIDPFGSILLPFMMYVVQIGVANPIIFGSAKPVPVDFNNLKPQKLGMALVALAGPFSNLCLAIIFAIIIKVGLVNVISLPILVTGIYINLLLFVFNLIPIPPLDGSKVFAALAPEEWANKLFEFERYGFILIFIFLYTGILEKIYSPVIRIFFNIFGF